MTSALAFCFSHGEKKLENTTQFGLKQEVKLKIPLLIELPLLLPTTSQIQELSTQFLYIQESEHQTPPKLCNKVGNQQCTTEAIRKQPTARVTPMQEGKQTA